MRATGIAALAVVMQLVACRGEAEPPASQPAAPTASTPVSDHSGGGEHRRSDASAAKSTAANPEDKANSVVTHLAVLVELRLRKLETRDGDPCKELKEEAAQLYVRLRDRLSETDSPADKERRILAEAEARFRRVRSCERRGLRDPGDHPPDPQPAGSDHRKPTPAGSGDTSG